MGRVAKLLKVGDSVHPGRRAPTITFIVENKITASNFNVY